MSLMMHLHQILHFYNLYYLFVLALLDRKALYLRHEKLFCKTKIIQTVTIKTEI